MIKFFTQYDFHGLVIRDPITATSNLLLFLLGLWCYRRVAKINTTVSAEMREGIKGWKFFFLVSAFAYLIGVPVHGFSFYIPEHIHFWIWIAMGWTQILAVYCIQLGTAKQFYRQNLHWIHPLLIFQVIFFSALMVYIRKFGAVNADIAVGLVPIAVLNIYMYSKKQSPSYLIGAGILFAILPALVVILKWMPTPWLSYNDIAHFLLMGSLITICRGVVKCAN